MNQWNEVDFFYILLGFLAAYLIFRFRPFLYLKTPMYLENWRSFADEIGLEVKPGSFRGFGKQKQPEISGSIHGREIKITSDFIGGLGYRYALINFIVFVENPSTQKLPAGAFLVIRKDPRAFGFWYRLRKSLLSKPEEPMILRDQYQIQSIPSNLGNFIFRQKTTEKLLQLPGVINLYIDRKNLSFNRIGLLDQRELMHLIIENLCELGENFDRFARNWI
jgi:hypothetical protein